MKTDNNHKLKRIWTAALFVLSWILCLVTVNYPADHVLGYYPVLMYVMYSLMGAFSIAALVLIFLKKPLLSDILSFAVLACYFVMFGIIFIQHLLNGYVIFMPMMTISLFLLAIAAIATAVLLLANRKREGYLLAIVTFSFFTLSVVLESYPVAYDEVSEIYGNIKLVYFVAIIASSILGIINSAQMYKENK
ncbi:MAG: hypothetical protein WC160_00420 [Bacilli bacterium]|jgi:hypothetical protein|nr:hypothetical protein [Candidatus Izemoplasmatales bacterium]HPV70228.1 hypothetical protein [Bacilli bacterium]